MFRLELELKDKASIAKVNCMCQATLICEDECGKWMRKSLVFIFVMVEKELR